MLLVVSFVLGVGFFNVEKSNFNYDSYVEEETVIEMLNVQFVKDIQSEELVQKLEGFMSNYMDNVDHVTGHFAKESDMFYYAVYGSKDGAQTFDLVEVNKSNFDSETYYDYSEAASLFGTCRRGNGYPFPPVCPGTACYNWPNGGCLGIICPPAECL